MWERIERVEHPLYRLSKSKFLAESETLAEPFQESTERNTCNACSHLQPPDRYSCFEKSSTTETTEVADGRVTPAWCNLNIEGTMNVYSCNSVEFQEVCKPSS